jgi:hypothetical protein
VSELLAERIEPDDRVVASIFGTTDSEAIWAHVRALCPEAVDCFAFRASVGALFGLELHGGSRVALKVHPARSSEYLTAMQQVQEHVWRHGFPAPRPLGVRGRATLEEWRDEGVYRDAHEPAVRRALAQQLVRLTQLTSGVRPGTDLPPFFPRAVGPLWPPPHNVLFDFEATAHGAAWIDEIATSAKAQRDAGGGEIVIAHHDWTAAHIRFRDLRPTAVYDWDSLSSGFEPVFVGEAAGHFTYTEHLDVELWPTVDETFMFIADYERARSAPFSREEQITAAAAAVYGRAYTTRCVHALLGDVDELVLREYAAALLQ